MELNSKKDLSLQKNSFCDASGWDTGNLDYANRKSFVY
jgi:hypothetical protein